MSEHRDLTDPTHAEPLSEESEGKRTRSSCSGEGRDEESQRARAGRAAFPSVAFKQQTEDMRLWLHELGEGCAMDQECRSVSVCFVVVGGAADACWCSIIVLEVFVSTRLVCRMWSRLGSMSCRWPSS